MPELPENFSQALNAMTPDEFTALQKEVLADYRYAVSPPDLLGDAMSVDAARTKKAKKLQLVKQRFGKYCFYCETAKATTIDHFYPKAVGGKNSLRNLVPACVDCNNKKGCRLPTQKEIMKIKALRRAIR